MTKEEFEEDQAAKKEVSEYMAWANKILSNKDGKKTPMNNDNIRTHEGKKYLRSVRAADGKGSVEADVYSVLEAFKVTCPATAHAVKKLLCAGERGKGDRFTDLVGAKAALNRAIELEGERRVGESFAARDSQVVE